MAAQNEQNQKQPEKKYDYKTNPNKAFPFECPKRQPRKNTTFA